MFINLGLKLSDFFAKKIQNFSAQGALDYLICRLETPALKNLGFAPRHPIADF